MTFWSKWMEIFVFQENNHGILLLICDHHHDLCSQYYHWAQPSKEKPENLRKILLPRWRLSHLRTRILPEQPRPVRPDLGRANVRHLLQRSDEQTDYVWDLILMWELPTSERTANPPASLWPHRNNPWIVRRTAGGTLMVWVSVFTRLHSGT